MTTFNGFEVDFITHTQPATKALYQVCESLIVPETAEREIRALREAMKETGLQEGCIITRLEQDEMTPPEGVIHVVPVWKSA